MLPASRKNRRVWLAVSGLLLLAFGLSIPRLRQVWAEKAPVRRCQAQLKDLQHGLTHFHTEYQRFPMPARMAVPTDRDADLRSWAISVPALTGADKSLNPREIRFWDDRPFRVRTGTEVSLTDPWGEPFHLTLDSDQSGKIDNPAADASPAWLAQHPQPPRLRRPVAVFSSGPDRNPDTWQDNVAGWPLE